MQVGPIVVVLWALVASGCAGLDSQGGDELGNPKGHTGVEGFTAAFSQNATADNVTEANAIMAEYTVLNLYWFDSDPPAFTVTLFVHECSILHRELWVTGYFQHMSPCIEGPDPRTA